MKMDVLFKNHWTDCAHQKTSTRHIILICSEISVLAALAVKYNCVSPIKWKYSDYFDHLQGVKIHPTYLVRIWKTIIPGSMFSLVSFQLQPLRN